MDFGAKFENGRTYQDFLGHYADEGQERRWDAVYESVALTEAQRSLLQAFIREMKVLVLAGTWCGDCVNQCPIFERFAEATDRLRVHYFDRDDNADLAGELVICGAPRVPAVLFLSEDDHVCGRYGDRTLSKYRRMAATLTGAACPSGISTTQEELLLVSVVQEWLNEFERIQLMLRTSGRLRELHGD